MGRLGERVGSRLILATLIITIQNFTRDALGHQVGPGFLDRFFSAVTGEGKLATVFLQRILIDHTANRIGVVLILDPIEDDPGDRPLTFDRLRPGFKIDRLGKAPERAPMLLGGPFFYAGQPR